MISFSREGRPPRELLEKLLVTDPDFMRFTRAQDIFAPADTPIALIHADEWIRSAPPPPDPIIEKLFDTADKVPIIGSSKSRKTFFALQLALCLAAGRGEFLRWTLPKARRVLFVQLEVKAAHFWRRVHTMAGILDIPAAAVGDRLAIANLRGKTVSPEVLLQLAEAHKAEVVVVDPIYKMLTGDENKAMDVKPLFAAFDQLTEKIKATVIYVHHNPKGVSGDRDARDRGAGSGVIARDYDAAIYVDEHKDGDEMFVITTILRNYAPQQPFTIRWNEGRFDPTEQTPVVRTSKNRNQSGPAKPLDEEEIIAKIFSKGPLNSDQTLQALTAAGFTQARARSIRQCLPRFQKRGRNEPVWYGTEKLIEGLKTTYANPSLTTISEQA